MKDFCLTNNSVFISDEIESIIQQIDLLFDTQKNEVYGEDYGSSFYDLLWDMSISANDVSDYTESIIYGSVDLRGWTVNVSTDIIQGTINDIFLVKVILSKYEEKIEKIYRIE